MCNQYNFNIPRVIFSFPSHNIALPLSSLPPGCSQFLATLSIILWSYSRVMYELRADTGEVQRLESGSDIMSSASLLPSQITSVFCYIVTTIDITQAVR